MTVNWQGQGMADKPDLSTIGLRLEHLRAMRGMTKADLQREAQLGDGEGTRLATRKRMDPDRVERILEALKAVECRVWALTGSGSIPTLTKFGDEPPPKVFVSYDAVNHKEAVMQTPAFTGASKAIKDRFVESAPNTANDEFRDFDDYMNHLLALKKAAKLLGVPANAERIDVDEPDPGKRR